MQFVWVPLPALFQFHYYCYQSQELDTNKATYYFTAQQTSRVHQKQQQNILTLANICSNKQPELEHFFL